MNVATTILAQLGGQVAEDDGILTELVSRISRPVIQHRMGTSENKINRRETK